MLPNTDLIKNYFLSSKLPKNQSSLSNYPVRGNQGSWRLTPTNTSKFNQSSPTLSLITILELKIILKIIQSYFFIQQLGKVRPRNAGQLFKVIRLNSAGTRTRMRVLGLPAQSSPSAAGRCGITGKYTRGQMN